MKKLAYFALVAGATASLFLSANLATADCRGTYGLTSCDSPPPNPPPPRDFKPRPAGPDTGGPGATVPPSGPRSNPPRPVKS